MSKQLLSEQEIRKMMKFANLHTLSNNFLSENAVTAEENIDEATETTDTDDTKTTTNDNNTGTTNTTTTDTTTTTTDTNTVNEEEEMEIEDEVEVDDAPHGGVDVMELVDRLAATIADVTGVPVTATQAGGEAPGLDQDVAVEPEPELEGPAVELDDEEPAGRDMYQEKAHAEEEEELKETSTEEVVNEVTRRVAKRLVEMSKKDKK